MRFFWPRAESRIYAEARSLERAGLAIATRTMHGKRPRTTYTISSQGRRRVAEWLAQPPRATALECEPILRVLLADLGTIDQLHQAIDQVEADAHAVLEVGRVVGREYLEGTAPFQDDVHARALVFDFLSNHALMLLAWAGTAREAVDTWPDESDADRQAAAVATIRRCLAKYPDAAERPPHGRRRGSHELPGDVA
jgi:PadR family transcriptional regulator AphA